MDCQAAEDTEYTKKLQNTLISTSSSSNLQPSTNSALRRLFVATAILEHQVAVALMSAVTALMQAGNMKEEAKVAVEEFLGWHVISQNDLWAGLSKPLVEEALFNPDYE
jgi:hypothetical protein